MQQASEQQTRKIAGERCPDQIEPPGAYPRCRTGSEDKGENQEDCAEHQVVGWPLGPVAIAASTFATLLVS